MQFVVQFARPHRLPLHKGDQEGSCLVSFPPPLYVDRKSSSFCAHPRCYLCSRSEEALRALASGEPSCSILPHSAFPISHSRSDHLPPEWSTWRDFKTNPNFSPKNRIPGLQTPMPPLAQNKNVYQRTQRFPARKCENNENSNPSVFPPFKGGRGLAFPSCLRGSVPQSPIWPGRPWYQASFKFPGDWSR